MNTKPLQTFLSKEKQKKSCRKGFTLVELIVVLVILAILAAILVPALLGWIDRARHAQLVLNGKTAYLAAQTIASEHYGVGDNNLNSSDKTNRGILSLNGQEFNYTMTFDSENNTNIRSGSQVRKLIGISIEDPYVCWIHFTKGKGITIDAIALGQEDYTAVLKLSSGKWEVKEYTLNYKKVPSDSDLTALFGTLP